MALDQATSDFLASLAAAGAEPLNTLSPAQARERSAQITQILVGPEVARVEELEIPLRDGASIAGRLVVPEDPVALMVYYHGGGWVIGSVAEFDSLGRALADRTRCAVLLVDYRLAPEHPFPTAVDDAYDALEWAGRESLSLLGRQLPLVVAGDSAGGNLAAVVARRAAHGPGPEIALQVLVYPVTDCDLDRPSYVDPGNQLALDRGSMVWFWDHYVPDVDARVHPDASPLRADDLSGLPPALVLTAEHDPLRDEGEAYADGMSRAGVEVEQHRVAGQMHGFLQLVDILPGSDTGLRLVREAIDRHCRSSAQDTQRELP